MLHLDSPSACKIFIVNISIFLSDPLKRKYHLMGKSLVIEHKAGGWGEKKEIGKQPSI